MTMRWKGEGENPPADELRSIVKGLHNGENLLDMALHHERRLGETAGRVAVVERIRARVIARAEVAAQVDRVAPLFVVFAILDEEAQL